jgi:hypothetical protein
MRPEKNGMVVQQNAVYGPYRIWHCDKWKCPKCGVEILVGFGDQPVADHNSDSFKNEQKKVNLVFTAD